MYTRTMQPTLTSITPDTTSIVIDCSKLFSGPSTQPVDQVIDWVKTSPRGCSLRVCLKSSGLHAQGRRLQSALQRLGCTVTRMQQMPVSMTCA